MSTITKISIQKNNSRANVFVDGKYSFALTLEEVYKNNLKKGNLINQTTIDKLKYVDLQIKTLSQVLNFLSFRPRSRWEIQNYLHKKLKEIPSVTQNKTIKAITLKLEKDNLIDDGKFINWWLEQRANFKPKGEQALFFELKKRGIDSQLINTYLSKLNKNSLFNSAQELAKKKIHKLNHLSFFKQKTKLYQYLRNRGFSFEIIKKVVDENMKKE